MKLTILGMIAIAIVLVMSLFLLWLWIAARSIENEEKRAMLDDE